MRKKRFVNPNYQPKQKLRASLFHEYQRHLNIKGITMWIFSTFTVIVSLHKLHLLLHSLQDHNGTIVFTTHRNRLNYPIYNRV